MLRYVSLVLMRMLWAVLVVIKADEQTNAGKLT